MATAEERIKILKMIQEGRISAEQGVQLLEALEEGARRSPSNRSQPPNFTPSPAGKGGRWFRVLITDTDTGRARVNVRLPAGLIQAGINMGARFSPQVEGFDLEQLKQYLVSGETGKIIDVVNEDESEHIEVFIE